MVTKKQMMEQMFNPSPEAVAIWEARMAREKRAAERIKERGGLDADVEDWLGTRCGALGGISKEDLLKPGRFAAMKADVEIVSLVAEIMQDLRGVRDAHGGQCEVDLRGFINRDATSGFWIDPLADETLHALASFVGSRAQAVRCHIQPALRESPIEGLTVLD